MRLRSYLDANDIDPPVFAQDISVTAASVYRYIDGTRVPRPAVMAKIAEVTKGKVQPNDFFAPAEPTPASAP